MYIAPGQGLTTPWGQTFVNRKPLSSCPLVAGLTKIALSPNLYTIMILSFWTDMPGQTVKTQIRLPFRRHRLGSLLYGTAT